METATRCCQAKRSRQFSGSTPGNPSLLRFHANVIEFSFQFIFQRLSLCSFSNNRKSDSFTTSFLWKVGCSSSREIPCFSISLLCLYCDILKQNKQFCFNTIKRFDEPRIHGRCLLWIIIDFACVPSLLSCLAVRLPVKTLLEISRLLRREFLSREAI